MSKKRKILMMVKTAVSSIDPNAAIILYGSYARGDYNENSDIDLLVLINKETVTRADQKKIKYPLYDIEFETGIIISPMIFSKKDWETKHRKTPFYESITKEGQVL